MKHFLIIAVLCSTIVACKKSNDHLPPDFNYEIPAVAITENVTVGAYYYNYSTADWAKKYSDVPELGEYSALNAATMEQHRKWADQGGIDFFIFNWNGNGPGNPLLNSFVQNRNNQVKMVINYNTAHLSATNASPLTGTKLNTMITELKTLAASHFNNDYYYKLEGKPVILITPLNLSTNAAASINFATVIPAVKDALKATGIELYVIGEITSGWLPPARFAPAIRAMDGIDLNNWATDVYDRASFFPSFSDMNWKNWSDSTTSWNIDFVPCIFPGYNDKASAPASKIYDLPRSEKFYTDYCNVAKRNMSRKRLVLVNSWNNFQVSTALEPAQSYGSTYLDITRQQFKTK